MMWIVGLLSAHAHIELDQPPGRYAAQKDGPCGHAYDARTPMPTLLPSGATIEVRWREFVQHPSHYRIAFDADGADFIDPPAMDSFYDAPAGDPDSLVLLDDIEDADGSQHVATVVLPDIECDACTLQLIQVMYDKPPFAPGDNDIYYQCADLVLRVDAPPTPIVLEVPSRTSEDDAASPTGMSGTSDSGALTAQAAAASGCSTGGGAFGWSFVALCWIFKKSRL